MVSHVPVRGVRNWRAVRGRVIIKRGLMGISIIHTKTTLLSSLVIIVAILMAALILTSAAIANIERTDDQTLAETEAQDLAQHVSDLGPSPDPETVDGPKSLTCWARSCASVSASV